jgi:hypothetical protein
MASPVLPPPWSGIVATSTTTVITTNALQNINKLYRLLVQRSTTKTSNFGTDIELLRLLSICTVDTTNRLGPHSASSPQPSPHVLRRPPAPDPADDRDDVDSAAGSSRRSSSSSSGPNTPAITRCSIPGCQFKGTHQFIIKLSDTRHCHSKFPDNKIPRSIRHRGYRPISHPIPSRGDAILIGIQHAEAKKKKKTAEVHVSGSSVPSPAATTDAESSDQVELVETKAEVEIKSESSSNTTTTVTTTTSSSSSSSNNSSNNEGDEKRQNQLNVPPPSSDHNTTTGQPPPASQQPIPFKALPIPSVLAPAADTDTVPFNA